MLHGSHVKFLNFRKFSYFIATLTLFFTLNQVRGLYADTDTHILLSTTNKMQRYTIFLLLSMLYIFEMGHPRRVLITM
jgi:hypothetical protein